MHQIQDQTPIPQQAAANDRNADELIAALRQGTAQQAPRAPPNPRGSLRSDWEQINQDQRFIDFMRTTDSPHSGRPLIEALADARESLDPPQGRGAFRRMAGLWRRQGGNRRSD